MEVESKKNMWMWTAASATGLFVVVFTLYLYYTSADRVAWQNQKIQNERTAIERDVRALRIDGLDAELKDINAELNKKK